MSFMGGVDSQFVLADPQKTPEDVRREVIKRIDEMASPEGGYIIDPSHSFPYDKEKLAAMEEAAYHHGREIFHHK
jgi:uroporphyrinogen-III decarboxylase